MVVAGCGPRPPAVAPAATAAEDARAVEAVLHAWYDASARHDSVAYAAPLLSEFFIFEDTTRYDKPTLVGLVAASFAQGTDRATLSDLQTVVAGDAAWTSFKNTEVFTPLGASPLPARRYLETAVFRRVDGQWRLERYHATHINRDPPAH
jgi:ketosteroid isomerase-like protein